MGLQVVEGGEVVGLGDLRLALWTFLLSSERVFDILEGFRHCQVLNLFNIVSESLRLKILKRTDKFRFWRVHG